MNVDIEWTRGRRPTVQHGTIRREGPIGSFKRVGVYVSGVVGCAQTFRKELRWMRSILVVCSHARVSTLLAAGVVEPTARARSLAYTEVCASLPENVRKCGVIPMRRDGTPAGR